MRLVKDPNKLRKALESKPINQEDIDKISTTLLQELTRHGGIGLSANQIGLDVRACVINVKEPLVLINPKVTFLTEERIHVYEGCLSVPNMRGQVDRCPEILIEGFDRDGQEVSFISKGISAGTFQHELDHLDGIEYFQRANPIHKDRFKRKWKKVYRTIRNKAKQAK